MKCFLYIWWYIVSSSQHSSHLLLLQPLRNLWPPQSNACPPIVSPSPRVSTWHRQSPRGRRGQWPFCLRSTPSVCSSPCYATLTSNFWSWRKKTKQVFEKWFAVVLLSAASQGGAGWRSILAASPDKWWRSTSDYPCLHSSDAGACRGYHNTLLMVEYKLYRARFVFILTNARSLGSLAASSPAENEQQRCSQTHCQLLWSSFMQHERPVEISL